MDAFFDVIQFISATKKKTTIHHPRSIQSLTESKASFLYLFSCLKFKSTNWTFFDSMKVYPSNPLYFYSVAHLHLTENDWKMFCKKGWESTGFNSGIEYNINTRAGNQDKARGHGGLLWICIAYHKIRAQPDAVKATREFLILAGPGQDPEAQLWRRLHLFWIFSVRMCCHWIPFPEQRINRPRRRVRAFCTSSSSLGARMRQEMSVWYVLSSGEYTNSSRICLLRKDVVRHSALPCRQLFWVFLQLFCSFNPHMILFVLIPKPAMCHNCSGIGHQSAKHDCPSIRPQLCWLWTAPQRGHHSQQQQGCLPSKWVAPLITNLLVYTNCSQKALLLARFFFSQTLIASFKPMKYTMLKLQFILGNTKRGKYMNSSTTPCFLIWRT